MTVQWVIFHRSRSLSSCNLIVNDLVHKDILQGQWQQNNYYFKNERIFEILQQGHCLLAKANGEPAFFRWDTSSQLSSHQHISKALLSMPLDPWTKKKARLVLEYVLVLALSLSWNSWGGKQSQVGRTLQKTPC